MPKRLTDPQAQMRRDERAWEAITQVMTPDRIYELLLRHGEPPTEAELSAASNARCLCAGFGDTYCVECRHVTDAHGLCEVCALEIKHNGG